MESTICTYGTRFDTINKASAAEVRPLNDALANHLVLVGGGVMGIVYPIPHSVDPDNLHPTHAALTQRPAAWSCPASVEGAAA